MKETKISFQYRKSAKVRYYPSQNLYGTIEAPRFILQCFCLRSSPSPQAPRDLIVLLKGQIRRRLQRLGGESGRFLVTGKMNRIFSDSLVGFGLSTSLLAQRESIYCRHGVVAGPPFSITAQPPPPTPPNCTPRPPHTPPPTTKKEKKRKENLRVQLVFSIT